MWLRLKLKEKFNVEWLTAKLSDATTAILESVRRRRLSSAGLTVKYSRHYQLERRVEKLSEQNCSLLLLTRTIKYDEKGNVISDTVTNHLTNKIIPTPKKTLSKSSLPKFVMSESLKQKERRKHE
jgi:hypothetical protein